MSNNHRKENDITNTSWTSLQNSFMDSTSITGNSASVEGRHGIYNDIYNNSNTMYQQSNLQPERYTVLPVGHGNFLKVYHTHENNEQQTFNNYELFSNNSFIPSNPISKPSTTGMSKGTLGAAGLTTQVPTMNYDCKKSFDNNDNTTSMLINQLVTNWTPNLSGTYSPFGEQQTMSNFSSNVILNDTVNRNQSQSSNNLNQQIMNSSENQFPSSSPPSSKTNGNFENNSLNSGQTVEVKKRIIAEVKPMRMSYSDVLSKNVSTNNKVNVANGNISTPTTAINSNSESNIQVRNKVSSEKVKSNTSSTNEKKSSFVNDDKEKFETKQRKHEIPFVQKTEESSGVQSSVSKEKKKNNSANYKDESQFEFSKVKKSASATKTTKQKSAQINNAENSKRKSSKKEIEDDERTSNSKINDKDGLYNITKNDYNNGSEKKSSQYTSCKKPKLSSNSIPRNNNNNTRFERQTYSKRNQRNQRDIKYDLISKFFEKWLEYTMKIVSWLFYLIYDIIVLGFSMVCDRVHTFYGVLYSYFVNFHHDFKNNSGKLWIKNLFKKFDGKFKKNSKWAFWRKFYKKKPSEPLADFYKNGRLPQTGDEAMYSLLNCKGKDAYSILGVTADSSQEQIRKHYKKIAVLVHPDKNKQPGAEEAFKVLQRAFELVGEPENRQKYDQSLAEALNAEKAWTELHDLLSQLQSKIAEAANTIRCSSCGLRHPRKLTERPHYAARECSSCKIKHSAREGDIWAETSIFGLRWKYLALMEGKVYDITEWANCQKGALSQLQPNSHIVQYRIVRGGQQQQHQQQQQATSQLDKDKLKKNTPCEPSLDDFLDNLYSGQNPQNQQNSSRKRTKRN